MYVHVLYTDVIRLLYHVFFTPFAHNILELITKWSLDKQLGDQSFMLTVSPNIY